MPDKLRIIVGGLVGQYPLGGVAWDYFHYVLGLAELGHEVYYHEDTWTWPFNPVGGYPVDDPAYTADFIGNFFRRYAPELAERWCYVLLHDKHLGIQKPAWDDICRTADVYLNVSGACFLPDELGPNCRRVFIDTDPGYNQILMATRPAWSEHVDRWVSDIQQHDVHLTYAENIHGDDCLIPKVGIDWVPTRCVVTLPPWQRVKEATPPPGGPFTTVMTWRHFNGPVEWQGTKYHAKVEEFDKFFDLPRRTKVPLELAVAGSTYDPEAVRQGGWQFARALPVSVTPEGYQDYIMCSVGEWSVAKNIYVATRSGWFSCRTACYLAAGRPAVVQDTAWSKTLPPTRGCQAFTTTDEAVAALNRAAADPKAAAESAYETAREHLAPDRVLTRMLDDIGST
jgi:hypothetical protein